MADSTIRSVTSIPKAYQVRLRNGIQKGEDALDLVSNIPEDFSLQSQSKWDELGKASPMIGGALEFAGGIDSVLKFFGRQNAVTTNLTQFPVWQGNEPVSFQIPFNLYALSSAKDEVIDPVVKLLRFMTPTLEDNLMLHVPGPTLKLKKEGDWLGGFELDKKYYMTLTFGTFLRIKGVIIENVTPTFQSTFTPRGYPLSAKVEVSVRTVLPPTSQDIANWFSRKSDYDDTIDSIVKKGQDLVEKAGKYLKGEHTPGK